MSEFTIFNTLSEQWSRKYNSWEKFYNDIKDPAWPACYNESQFFNLPKYIQDEIIKIHGGQRFVCPTDEDFEDLTSADIKINNTDEFTSNPTLSLSYQIGDDFFVYYNDFMNAGGTGYVQNYPRVLKYCYPNRVFDRCLDWCAGAGFLGFRLLADNICNNVTLMDCFEPSLIACNKTISEMPEQYKGKVDVIKSSTIKDLGTKVKYDLIVGNPPGTTIKRYSAQVVNSLHEYRLSVDQDWMIHKEFFKNIRFILSDNGVIVLQKFSAIHDISDFEDLIHSNDLKVTKIFRETAIKDFWYFVVTAD